MAEGLWDNLSATVLPKVQKRLARREFRKEHLLDTKDRLERLRDCLEALHKFQEGLACSTRIRRSLRALAGRQARSSQTRVSPTVLHHLARDVSHILPQPRMGGPTTGVLQALHTKLASAAKHGALAADVVELKALGDKAWRACVVWEQGAEQAVVAAELSLVTATRGVIGSVRRRLARKTSDTFLETIPDEADAWVAQAGALGESCSSVSEVVETIMDTVDVKTPWAAFQKAMRFNHPLTTLTPRQCVALTARPGADIGAATACLLEADARHRIGRWLCKSVAWPHFLAQAVAELPASVRHMPKLQEEALWRRFRGADPFLERLDNAWFVLVAAASRGCGGMAAWESPPQLFAGRALRDCWTVSRACGDARDSARAERQSRRVLFAVDATS